MNNDDLNMNEFSFDEIHKETMNSFLDDILPISAISDNHDMFNVSLEASIDNTIEMLEKVLNLEALSDDELAELYATDAELHEDIEMLDFDDSY